MFTRQPPTEKFFIAHLLTATAVTYQYSQALTGIYEGGLIGTCFILIDSTQMLQMFANSICCNTQVIELILF